MTRFLRFEVGGASALFWAVLFLAPYLDMTKLVQVDATKLFVVFFGSVALSLPLGNYVHQVTARA